MTEPEKPKESDQGLVEAVAKALFMENLRQHDEYVSRKSFNVGEFSDYFVSLEDESDRALAVFAFAYIETLLLSLMKDELNQDIPGGVESLFESHGPLQTASDRIKMSAALYWISKSSMQDLELLRKIRNEFAHRHKAVGFDDPIVRGLLSSMRPREQRVLKVKKLGRDLTTREAFHVRAILVCADMVQELMSAPGALRRSLPARAGLERPYEELPDIFKKVRLAAAVAIVALLDNQRTGGRSGTGGGE